MIELCHVLHYVAVCVVVCITMCVAVRVAPHRRFGELENE